MKMARHLHMAIGTCFIAATGLAIIGCAGKKAMSENNTNKETLLRARQDSLQAAIKDSLQSFKRQNKDAEGQQEKIKALSQASQLMVKACDNYLTINPESQKATDVLLIKASLFYNNKLFEEARASYKTIIDKLPKDVHAIESIRMIAQSYYEEKKFDDAQVWYRKLKDRAVEGTDKQEALSRIAESIFKLGETYDSQGKFKDAASEYERVSLEFPDSKIADVSLFNAGLAYEKMSEWSQSILMYQKLLQKYMTSKLSAKAQFRTAKNYEKLQQWDNAGETYLRVVANFGQSDLASVSLYNAGFCFENANKLPVAAATFEKMAQLFPQSDDAADVLFRAGEIYGKIKDWASVTRVNQEFMRRFGSDANRVIQAQCMVGVAMYMQNRQAEALDQLTKAIATFSKLKEPSTTNKYYAAKAEFTIGEINHEAMTAIALTQPKEAYKRQLKAKSDFLDNCIANYSRVIKYQISEWTTRSIYSIAKAYEDFAVAIFKQQRPSSMTMEERMALELGIAEAMEDYIVNKAAHYYEENVKLGIKEKIEDKYVQDSRQKLTSLPYSAGENYLALVTIAQTATTTQKLEGFALVAKKLETLQKIGPFQERAIALFLKCLENGSRYKQIDECYAKASSLITKTSCTVGQTYADIAATAREAPIPSTFDPYEAFVYKTKLLKQIETYEDKSLENFLRTLKIAEAYKIEDEFVKQVKYALPKLLFVRGRCYDILCAGAFSDPPFPKNVNEAEKEEYRARFEEIAMQFQENAFDMYKSIIAYAKQDYALGEYVTHAYVRMYQKYPKDYGVKTEKTETRRISSGPEWKCSVDTSGNWFGLEFVDTAYKQVQKSSLGQAITISGFPDNKVPTPMWWGEGSVGSANYVPAKQCVFRRMFFNYDMLKEATLWFAAVDDYTVYCNEKQLVVDAKDTSDWTKAKKWDLIGKLREGKNVLAIYVKNNIKLGFGCMPSLTYSVLTNAYVPKPPQSTVPLDPKQVSEGAYQFPVIANFPLPLAIGKTIGK